MPAIADANWGTIVSNYLIAIASGCLQKTGGTFTLTQEVDFGATYGLKVQYLKSKTTSVATAGVLRLAQADTVSWRNATNSADLALAVNGSNQLTFNGTVLQAAGNYITALTGDVTASGPGSAAATISSGAVTAAKLAVSAVDLATTVVTGTLAIAKGGTGQTTAATAFNALSPLTTLGDVLYGGASGVGTRLAGSTSATKQFLTQTGTGSVSAAPAWGTIQAADVPTLNQNTTGTASNVTGTVAIANGGTGQTSANAALNAILPAQTSNANKALVTDGSNTSWVTVASAATATPTAQGLTTSYAATIQSAIKAVASADYTVTTTDGYHTVLVTTGASDRTITLPAASSNAGRDLVVKKVDGGAGKVTVTRAGSDTLDGYTTRVLVNQYDTIRLTCDGSATWNISKHPNTTLVYNKSGVATTAQAAGTQKNIFGAASGNGLTLQPGVWLVSATAELLAVSGTATPAGNGACFIALSATQDSGAGSNAGDDAVMLQDFKTNAQITTSIGLINLHIINTKITVASATTYYLNGYHGYAGTAPQWVGSIKAECVG